jgi:hydroxyacylglutathione hydrolase
MLFKRIESEGLAHYSYLLGDTGEAVVIDPRRDIDVYLAAEKTGYHIGHIMETHRNEDYLVGSIALAEKTGAEIWHADAQLPYRYGNEVKEGQEWRFGGNNLRAVSTPGHTPGSFSYVLNGADDIPQMVFTGDTLFAGEVGRTDLLGEDRIHEMTDRLYDSIVKKLLPLGDGVIVCPAHGAGSVCGSSITDRPLTTIGIERHSNPRLQIREREEFIRAIGINLEKPPYFKKMEEENLSGPSNVEVLPELFPLSPERFGELAHESIILDTGFDGFGSAHIPGAINIWPGGLSSFAGWFIPVDWPLLLVCEDYCLETVVNQLRRIGYDRIQGYLAGGILAWHKAGRNTISIPTITVPELCYRLDKDDETWVLDVRSQTELDDEGEITGAYHIHVTQIPERSAEIPGDRPVFIFCGSGLRSMIAASLLQREGRRNINVVLGGFSAWRSVSCPLKKTQISPMRKVKY